MSALQKQAAPLVERLALGEWPVLSEVDCKVLARWAVMVSINLQCYARILGAAPYQRQALKNGAVPSGWKVSIGLMTNTNHAGSSFHRSMLSPFQIDPDKYVPVDSTYFCVERVAFYTLSTLDDLMFPYSVGLSGGEPPLPTRPIWPFDLEIDPTSGQGLTLEDLVQVQRHFGFNEQLVLQDAKVWKK
jgi:hypothetical protein